MHRAGLVHAESGYPLSYTLVIAWMVIVLGVLAILSMFFGIGPF